MSQVKAPTRAARAATNASAAAFSSHQNLSQVVRMLAGHAEAKQDVLAGVVHSAYYQALKHGNKAQLKGRENSLFEQATMYSKQANAKAAGFAQPKKAADYYAAHLCALEGVGIPDRLTEGDADAMAEGMALAYMGMVDAYLADIAAQAAEKRAASKAAKADAPKSTAAADAVADAVKAAAADKASTAPAAPALADMVAAVAAALVAGALTVEQHNALADAIEMANTLAVSAALAAAAQAEEAERVNADAELEAA